MTELRIGSRKSALALWQTNLVASRIREAFAHVTTTIVTMDTTGDKIRDKPMPSIGAKGLFTRELEEAMHAGEIDLAVHSLKDLPSALPTGLCLAATLERANPTDSLIAPSSTPGLTGLRQGAVVATGSVRRRAQLLAARPDLEFRELRGNIDTRLRKLEENGWDAIVMATAALFRLERPELTEGQLDAESFVPAVGQGAIGIEAREDRQDVLEMLAAINHEDTFQATEAERVFMAALQGGCSVPLAAHCDRVGEAWRFRGWIGSLDGRATLAETTTGSDPRQLAASMASSFIERGAREILGR